MENNNFKRKIKNINEVIIDNLLNKKHLHSNKKNILKNQKGGNSKVELKNTQSHLLKTIKGLDNITVPNASTFNETFKEISNQLNKINNNFLFLTSNKYLESSPKSFYDELTNFDKFLNDISGGKVEMTYKNDFKINKPLKLNLDSINKLDISIKDIGKILYLDKGKFSNLDINSLPFDNNLKISQNFIDKNYDIINEKIKRILKQFEIIDQLIKNIEVRILYFKSEFSDIKIKNIVKDLIVITKDDENEFEEIDGFNELIKIPKSSFENKFIIIDNKKYSLDDDPIYTQPEFVELIKEQTGENIKEQTAGSMDKYLDIAIKYNEIIRKRDMINKLKKTVEEYNIIYIQYYYYQFYLLTNINNFYTGNLETKGKLPIYKNLSYKSVETYWKILSELNKIIDEPNKIFSNINSRERTVQSVFYFRYFIIIKILFQFFNTIKEIWDKKELDKTYKAKLFSDKYDRQLNLEKVQVVGKLGEEVKKLQEIKDFTKYILIFNLSYSVLLSYSNSFMRKAETISL